MKKKVKSEHLNFFISLKGSKDYTEFDMKMARHMRLEQK